MAELILDECIFSNELRKTLREKLGIKISYLGNGLSDNVIRNYVNSCNSLLLTSDRQLCYSLGARALFLESKTKLKEIVRIVKIWLDGLQ